MEPFQITDPEEAENSVSQPSKPVIDISTPLNLMNEEAVGRGIKIQEFLEKTSSLQNLGRKTTYNGVSLLLKSH